MLVMFDCASCGVTCTESVSHSASLICIKSFTFRTVWYTSSYNVVLGVDWVEVGTRSSLPGVCRKWAPCLVRLYVFSWVSVIEVIVSGGVCSKRWVVEKRSKVDRGALDIEITG